MNIQTLVYDEDKPYAHPIVMDLCNTDAVLEYQDGNLIQERNELLYFLEEAIKDYDSCKASICEMNMNWMDELKVYMAKKKEPIGS